MMSLDIVPFAPGHARQVAEIHIEGQPGTFLTRLGPDFLTQLYRAMASSEWAFGSVIVDGEQVVGVGVVALNTARLFRDIKLHHWQHLVWPVIRQMLRQPALLGELIQSWRYPTRIVAPPGDAEMLFFGLRRAYMRHGLGPRLLDHLMEAAYQRGFSTLSALIDKRNRPVRWMIASLPSLRVDQEITLHGKTMLVYRVQLGSAVAGEEHAQ